jgi:hypothetical protein
MVTEEEFTGSVVARIDRLGLMYHHCRDSRKCAGRRGFPDLVSAGRRGVLFAELKMPDGETSAEQDLWAWTLRKAGQAWVLWEPADLDNGVIDGALVQLER